MDVKTALGALVIGAFIGAAGEAKLGAADPPSVEIHYAPEENLERYDLAAIGRATVSIDMAAYVLTDAAVIEALADAARRGARVRIWRDADMAGRVGEADVEERLRPGVDGLELRAKEPGTELMHLKGYCVDGRLMRMGSANFSRSGLARQDNDLALMRGPGVCRDFEAKFTAMWGS